MKHTIGTKSLHRVSYCALLNDMVQSSRKSRSVTNLPEYVQRWFIYDVGSFKGTKRGNGKSFYKLFRYVKTRLN